MKKPTLHCYTLALRECLFWYNEVMKAFIKDLLERALKTFAQALIATISIDGLSFQDINWANSLSIAGLASLVSVLTSIASYKFGETGTASVLKEEE